MKKKSRLLRARTTARRVVAATALVVPATALGVLLVSAFATPLRSYAQDAPKQRIVDGRVIDKGDKPLNGAVVYLKDSKSNSVKTFICGEDGTFHFGQLSPNNDYEVWAEISGHRSKNKSISSFDSKPKFNFTLTIDM